MMDSEIGLLLLTALVILIIVGNIIIQLQAALYQRAIEEYKRITKKDDKDGSI